MASKLTSLFKSKELTKYQNGVSGILYLGVGATLAATRNGQYVKLGKRLNIARLYRAGLAASQVA